MSDDVNDSQFPERMPAGMDWSPPSPEHLEALLSGYEVLELVGRGGMGAVYKARQISLDRVVAIKILPPGLWNEDLDYAERFRKEARLMARLMHPGMVAVFDFGQTAEGQLYFVMEFVEGTDVSRMIATRGALPPETARSIAIQVCETLEHAHKNGIIHRDIKPANVMVDTGGKVKVADFGLAKMPAQEMEDAESATTMGSPDYLAPECLETGSFEDHRVDIYALGVMLYEMLVGIVPRKNHFPPSNRVRGLDPRYDAIVARAMDRDATKRYPTAMDLQRDLARLATPAVAPAPAQKSAAAPTPGAAKPGARLGSPMRPQQPAPARYTPPAPQKSGTPWGLLAVMLLVIGGGAYFFLSRKQDSRTKVEAPDTIEVVRTAEPSPSPPTVPAATVPALPVVTGNGNQTEALELMKWVVNSRGKAIIKSGDQTRDVSTLEQLPEPGDWHLRVIDCGFYKVPKDTPVPWNLLASQPRLDAFFYNCEQTITREDMAKFSANPLLTRLNLDNVDSQDSALEGLPVISGMKSLRLNGCGMTGACLPILREKFPYLEQLMLGKVPVTNEQMRQILKFTSLWELRINETRLNAEMLGTLADAPELRNLSLVNCGFDFRIMPPLPRLKVFYIFNAGLPKPAKKEFIKSLSSLSELRSLTLQRCNLVNEDIAGIAALPNLDYLDLSTNQELGPAVTELAVHMPKLNNLVLNECKGITNASLRSLVACRQLQRVDLKNTNISDEGLAELKAMTGLKLLQLQGTQVTAPGVEALRKALPQCRVTL